MNPVTNQASVITYVTQISGLETFPGVAPGSPLRVGDPVNASFFDSQDSPSQQNTDNRDMLTAPPLTDEVACPAIALTQKSVQQNGNINVRPRN